MPSVNIVISDHRPHPSELINMENLNFQGSPLYQPAEELTALVKDERYSFVGAYEHGRLIGYCTGKPLRTKTLRRSPELKAAKAEAAYSMVNEAYFNKTVYIASFESLPQVQGLGIGSAVLDSFRMQVRDKGFVYIAGHFRQGPSRHLAYKVLKDVLFDIPLANFCDTGETYHFIMAQL